MHAAYSPYIDISVGGIGMIKARIRATFTGLLFVVMLPIASAQAQGSSLKDQLVGQWQLVSISINDAAPYGVGYFVAQWLS